MTPPTGLFGPRAPSREDSITGEGGKSGTGGGRAGEESVPGGVGSWIHSVASILDDLGSTADAPVRAEEGSPLCRGADCGSGFDSIGAGALALILLCLVLAVAGVLTIRARRSAVEHASAPDDVLIG